MSFQDDCKSYIQIHAKHAKLKANMDVLRARIVPQLRDGKTSPANLPFALVLRKRMHLLADWKEALKHQLKLWLEQDDQVDERMKEIQSGFALEETEALCVEINKSYAARL